MGLRLARTPAALLAVLTLLSGCTSTSVKVADPTAEVAAYALDWQNRDSAAASALTDDPGAATQLLTKTALDLSPRHFTVTPGAITRTGDTTASSVATAAWDLGEGVTWTYDVTWSWTVRAGSWRLDWSPTAIHPKLGPQQGLVVRLTKATDASMVDRDDSQIVNPTRVYSVIALKGKIADIPGTAASLYNLLQPLEPSLSVDAITAGITNSEPDTAYTVLNLREDSFKTVEAGLAALPGISTPSEIRSLPVTKDFAKAVLTQVTPIATKMMTGTAGWRIVSVDATGAELATLEEHAAVPGQKVTLTLDSKMQLAADTAVAAVTQPAVIVAIQPSTGEILAVSQNAPADVLGPIALTGKYPPGSIFKIITATAGIDGGGLTPTSSLDCPGTWTIDSRPISNAHMFDLGTVDLTLAFAKSCNTTFAKIASSLPADALNKAAKQYGVGLDFDITGIVTLTGQSPVAESVVQQAENGFGQGKDLLTPFSAALMAATVAHGSMPTPVLIRGAQTTVDQPAAARSPAVQSGLPILMRAVTAEGTGKNLQGFGEIFVKTGTAEFSDSTGAIHAHAWTVGYLGDLAFASFIVGGEDSTYTNNLTTAFLTSALAP